MALVSAAGPLSNLGVAFLTALAVRGLGASNVILPETAVRFLVLLMFLNVALCVFNLLPIAPLDGFGVAVGVLPWSVAGPIARLGQYGPGILMLLVFSAYIIHVDLLGMILNPLTRLLLVPLAVIVRGG
jgi:Zn-dependent protease